MVEPHESDDEGILVEVLAALDYPKTLSHICDTLDVDERGKPYVKKAVRKLANSDMIVKIPGKRWERTDIGNSYLKARTALVPISQGPLSLIDDLDRVDYIADIEKRALSCIDCFESFIQGRIELGWQREFDSFQKRSMALIQKAREADLGDDEVRAVIDGKILALENEVRSITGFSTLRQYINDVRSQAAEEERRLDQLRSAVINLEQQAGMSAIEVQRTMQSLQDQALTPNDIRMAKALTDEASRYGLNVQEALQYYSVNRGRFFNLAEILNATNEATRLFDQIHRDAQKEMDRNISFTNSNLKAEKRHRTLVNAIGRLHRDTVRALLRDDDYRNAFMITYLIDR